MPLRPAEDLRELLDRAEGDPVAGGEDEGRHHGGPHEHRALAGAQVLFQPIGGLGGVATGVGSFGRTDAEGRFTLEASTATPTPGAVPGKHTVRIALPPAKGASQDSDAANAGGKPNAQQANPIPAEYNEKTNLTFEVPAGGSKSADFALKGPALPKGK